VAGSFFNWRYVVDLDISQEDIDNAKSPMSVVCTTSSIPRVWPSNFVHALDRFFQHLVDSFV
jgi:hypothetical protein